MAERQSALKRAPARPALEALLEQAKKVTLTDDELQEQIASFCLWQRAEGLAYYQGVCAESGY
jgi:hypothetical protein